jgi:hypothetical protein
MKTVINILKNVVNLLHASFSIDTDVNEERKAFHEQVKFPS